MVALDNQIILLASRLGAVSGTYIRLEEGHGIKHGGNVGAVDVKVKLFSFAGAGVL